VALRKAAASARLDWGSEAAGAAAFAAVAFGAAACLSSALLVASGVAPSWDSHSSVAVASAAVGLSDNQTDCTGTVVAALAAHKVGWELVDTVAFVFHNSVAHSAQADRTQSGRNMDSSR
jgi:hypothetical protein